MLARDVIEIGASGVTNAVAITELAIRQHCWTSQITTRIAKSGVTAAAAAHQKPGSFTISKSSLMIKQSAKRRVWFRFGGMGQMIAHVQ